MIYALGDRVPVLKGDNYVAPNATVIGSVVMERNANVWWNVTIRGDSDLITLGENVNIQDGSVLHTDAGVKLTLEKDVSVGHMAMLHGCTVKEGSLIGIKAVVLNHAVIGRECLIGANALIPEGKVIPDNSLVMGSPGKIVREVSSEMAEQLTRSAKNYVKNWRRFAGGMREQEPD